MKDRCLNPRNKQYGDYGGRGITVCRRWMKFENFLADMGERPAGLTLDRLDGSRGYEPGNCRWATRVEQASNRRPHRPHRYVNGKSLHEWAEVWQVSYNTAKSRIRRLTAA